MLSFEEKAVWKYPLKWYQGYCQQGYYPYPYLSQTSHILCFLVDWGLGLETGEWGLGIGIGYFHIAKQVFFFYAPLNSDSNFDLILVRFLVLGPPWDIIMMKKVPRTKVLVEKCPPQMQTCTERCKLRSVQRTVVHCLSQHLTSLAVTSATFTAEIEIF